MAGAVVESVSGAAFAHLSIEQKIAADVGFGDSFVEPLSLAHEEQIQGRNSYRLVEQAEGWQLHRRRSDSDWEAQYAFTLSPRRLEDFDAMCHYQQTSPESSFTKKSVCSLATEDGRITLSNGRLIITAGGTREERDVASVEEYRALLMERFGVALGDEAIVGRLMPSPASSP